MCADASHLFLQRVIEEKWMHHVWSVSVCTLNLIFTSKPKTLNTPRFFSPQRQWVVVMMSGATQMYNNITHLHARTCTDNNARARIDRYIDAQYWGHRQKDTHSAHRRSHTAEERRRVKGEHISDINKKLSGVVRASARSAWLCLNTSYLGSKWWPKLWSTRLAWFSRAHSDSSPRLCYPEKTPSIPPDWVILTGILFESWEWKEPNIEKKKPQCFFSSLSSFPLFNSFPCFPRA